MTSDNCTLFFCCCSFIKSCLTLIDPWTAACQATLSFTISRSLLKLMSIEPVMPSNPLLLCYSSVTFLLLSLKSRCRLFLYLRHIILVPSQSIPHPLYPEATALQISSTINGFYLIWSLTQTESHTVSSGVPGFFGSTFMPTRF